MNTTYYIVRHGHTFYTKNKLEYGDKVLVARLAKSTYPQIKKIGNYFKNIKTEANFSSKILRARQTTKIINRESGKDFVYDSRLNEMYNESVDDLKNRVVDFLDEINKKNYNAVIIITHGAVIAALKHLLLENSFDESKLYDYPNPETVCIINGKNFEIIDFGENKIKN